MAGKSILTETKYQMIVMAVLIAGCCFLAYHFHVTLQSDILFTHFYYIPIILASIWWKKKGLIVAAFLSGFLVFHSHLFRKDVPLADDYMRASLFLIISIVVSLLSEQNAAAQKKAAHLNAVLDAGKKVSQLLTRNKDRESLLAGVCNSLIESRGYYNAWIVLLDEHGKFISAGEAGLGREFILLTENMSQGRLPDCSRKALAQRDVVVTEKPSAICMECCLSSLYTESGSMTVRLEYNGEIFGILSASVPKNFLAGDEEQALFKDVADDIAFALHSLKFENLSKRLEVQLQHAKRMEALGTLAGGIAHNFNNLLMIIMGNTSLMQMETHFEDKNYRRLKKIEESARKGSMLTNQLLGYAREAAYEVRPTDLNKVIKDTSRVFWTTRKTITVHLDLAEDLCRIDADQVQIGQVLLDIYLNAADAMPSGGHLFLKTANVTDEDMKQRPFKVVPGGYTLITVTDTGEGMDEETVDRIFEPFFTTKGLAKSTGLGLASVYGIVKAHGGYVEVDSRKNEGTTFKIYLPASQEAFSQGRLSRKTEQGER